MIRNKKTTSKLMSAISTLVAVIMLSTTVFASGILTDLTNDDYTIEILNNGEKIELVNKPFIENGEVYIPLRETFEKIGVTEHPDSKIEWDNGKIDLCIAFYADEVVTSEHQSLNNGQGFDIVTFIADHALEIGKSSIIANTVPNLAGQDVSEEVAMDNAPILKGSNTYIPYSYIGRILDSQRWKTEYIVYDKNGEPVFGGEDNEKMLAAADIWAQALITRNGLPRYEIMTEDMQKQFIAEQKRIAGENWNYVIGYSSPKTVSYDIDIYGHTAYITYLQADNTGEKYSIKEKISFEKTNGEFLVSAAEDIEYVSEATEK